MVTVLQLSCGERFCSRSICVPRGAEFGFIGVGHGHRPVAHGGYMLV